MDLIDHIKMNREIAPKEPFETLGVTADQRNLTFIVPVRGFHQESVFSISHFEDINGVFADLIRGLKQS
ncbi:MAG: hypothetical protein VX800_01030 [Chloroflexota bacterium]|nr:hypothetical protein [Chloroflexota bacterium]